MILGLIPFHVYLFCWCVEEVKENEPEAEALDLRINRHSFLNGHKLWVVANRTRLQQLKQQKGFGLQGGWMYLKELAEELLHIERGQLLRMPPGRLPGDLFQREETPGKTQDTLEGLCRLGVLADEPSRAREVWLSLLRLLPQGPDSGSVAEEVSKQAFHYA